MRNTRESAQAREGEAAAELRVSHGPAGASPSRPLPINRNPMRRRTLLLAAFLLLPAALRGEGKKPTVEKPRLIVAVPLGVAPGAPARVTLRGLRLDTATEVRCHEPKGSARVVAKGKAGGYSRKEDVPFVGDTQADIELTLPAEYANPTVTLGLVNTAGESNPVTVLVNRGPVVAEKEPNGGFAQAQEIQPGQVVAGTVDRPQDVDLYRFAGRAGQRITAEVLASRLGSPLDPFLTLYDAAGHALTADDDSAGSADPRVDVTLPRDGTYFLGVADANDQGGPAHVYRLLLRVK